MKRRRILGALKIFKESKITKYYLRVLIIMLNHGKTQFWRKQRSNKIAKMVELSCLPHCWATSTFHSNKQGSFTSSSALRWSFQHDISIWIREAAFRFALEKHNSTKLENLPHQGLHTTALGITHLGLCILYAKK